MTPGSIRHQKKLLRARLKASRREAHARLQKNPQLQQRQARRRRNIRIIIAALLLLLLLFLRCDCGPVSPSAPDAGTKTKPDAGLLQKPLAKPGLKKPPALDGRVERQSRGAFAPTPGGAPPWLDALHLQVAARSPRLAECFRGAERPGYIRWTASIHAEDGTVSDQELEPVGAGGALGDAQKTCLRRVLSSPPYHFTSPPPSPLPNQISMVIEF